VTLWVRLPVLVQAVVTGLAVATAGTIPWAALVAANIEHQPALPWAVPIMAVYLVSQYPVHTVLLWVLMSAVVAGVVEEIAFRGYLQRPIERRHGPVIAILVTGGLFGLIHFTHREVTFVLLPYYMAVAAVYGALAHLTDSTLPSMVLHGGGNVFSAFDLFTRGRSEWQLSAAPKPLIWEAGPDAPFLANTAALFVVGAAAVWAYSELSRAARTARPSAEVA
jgi:membrane protease YdiL (CAAX protease family)